MTRIILASLVLASLAACGSEPKGTSTAKLDAVEVQPGTISDSMILLDDAAGDGTAVDNSVPDDGARKAPAKPEDGAGDDSDDAAAETPDIVETPAAPKAATATGGAVKKGE